MFKSLVATLERQQLKSAAAKGALACPQCGTPLANPPTEPAAVVNCHACGHFGSASEWITQNLAAGGIGRAGTPPAGTRIQREAMGSTVVWDIPPSGKSGGLVAFGWVWTTFIAVFSSVWVYGTITGTSSKGSPPWFVCLFLLPFWAVGLGMLYAGYRMKNARHKVVIGDGKVTLAREWRGKIKKKSLPLADLTTIHQAVFYSKNYTPVYGVELKGSSGKLRFGSSLEEAEKAWLVAEFKEAVWPAKPAATPLAPSHPFATSHGPRPFTVLIPRSDSLLGFGLAMALIGAAFIGIGLFVIDGPAFTLGGNAREPMFIRIFESLFSVLSSGFRVIWCGMSSIFFLIGVAMIVSYFRNRDTEQRLEGTYTHLYFRKTRKGLTLSEQTFPRESFLDIRASQSGSSNNQPRMKVELLAGGRATVLARWMKAEDAEALVSAVRTSMR